MTFGITDIVTSVKVALDENRNSASLIEEGDIDTLAMEDIIKSKIEDAVRTITLHAPHHLLEGGKTFGENISWESSVGYGRGYIYLPKDFLRLVCFQMSDWSYPIFAPITTDDPLYQRQFSRFPGIKGNPQHPVVALTPNREDLGLEFFSCTAGKDVYIKQALYIPIPKIVDEAIEISQKLKPAVVYYIAYLVALTLGEANMATAMQNISNELLL